MAREFRLLRVRAAFGPQLLPLLGAKESVVSFSRDAAGTDSQPFVSVVIGKNGVGKSRSPRPRSKNSGCRARMTLMRMHPSALLEALDYLTRNFSRIAGKREIPSTESPASTKCY